MAGQVDRNTHFHRNEIDASEPKLFQRKDEMPNTSCESVKPPAEDHVDTASVDVLHQPVQFGPLVLGPADPDVDVLGNDLPSTLFRELAQSMDLHLGALIP